MRIKGNDNFVRHLSALKDTEPFATWLANSPSAYLYLSDLSREESQMLSAALEEKRETFQGYEQSTVESALRFLSFSLKLPDDPKKFPKISRLENIPPAVGKLARMLERGWIYREELGMLLPYLITGASYEPYEARTQTAAHTNIQLLAYGQARSKTIHIEQKDVKGGKSLLELLHNEGYVLETPELNAAHDAIITTFDEYRRKEHALFDLTPGAEYQENYWLTRGNAISGQFVLDMEHSRAERGRRGDKESAPVFDLWDEAQCMVPTHPYLHGFLLSHHTYASVLSPFLKPHVFRKQAEQIVLAPMHRRLIDVLTGQLSVLGDIVQGKNEGTTILALGAPGLGKTLTAEIYAEETERPLYKVQSGQLGTSAEDIEKNLKTIFQRARRWNAVLLIDEADTYIRERGSDIEQNAIVATFLRSMEYFDGLLFMTSNRLDIDDAILSRSSAIIEYQSPGKNERKKLWLLHAGNLGADLSDALAEQLAAKYDTSGRDVLNLLKLALRVAHKENVPLSMELFADLAPFKKIGEVKA